MNPKQVRLFAAKITEDIFSPGSGGTEITRLQMKSGSWAQGTEKDQGGLCRESFQDRVEQVLLREGAAS